MLAVALTSTRNQDHTVARGIAPPGLPRTPVLGNQARLRIAASPAPPLQAKLELGAVNYLLEHEADQVADQVMRTAEPMPVLAPPRLSRMCAVCGEEAGVQRKPVMERCDAVDHGNAWHQHANDDMAPIVSRGTAGGGHALDGDTRRFMEARFGRTFGSVRIHTGEAAEESTRSVNAVAYTVGNRIVFDAGHYAPGTTAGRRLLAHELAHTIQQGGAGPANTNRAAPAITAGAGDVVQRVGECDGKSFRECSGGCVPADGRGTGFCRWGMSPVTKESACICFRRDQPMLRAIQQALYNMIIAALITAGIVLTAAAIAAIIACLSGPCEVAALIAALGYAGAMIVLGIVRSGGGSGTSSGPTAQADTDGGSASGAPTPSAPA